MLWVNFSRHVEKAKPLFVSVYKVPSNFLLPSIISQIAQCINDDFQGRKTVFVLEKALPIVRKETSSSM